jgi:hypothetical protein
VSASTTDRAYSDIMPVAIKIEPTVPQSRQTMGVLDLPVDGTDQSIPMDFTSGDLKIRPDGRCPGW